MKKRSEETTRKISWLLELEKRPRTLNEHYYRDYRDKFFAYYRAEHHATNTGLANLLRLYDDSPSSTYLDPANRDNIRAVLNGLHHIGLSGVRAVDLLRLFPSDPYTPAFNIMATVRAYFQGM